MRIILDMKIPQINFHDWTLISIISFLFSGLGITLIIFLRNKYLFKKDESKIIAFFNREIGTTKFWTSHRIASEVNLTVNRVQEVCGNSSKFKRNQKEKDSYSLK
jgi:hypothetical protein